MIMSNTVRTSKNKPNTHFEIIGDGVAVLKISELKKDKEFITELKKMRTSMKIGKQTTLQN